MTADARLAAVFRESSSHLLQLQVFPLNRKMAPVTFPDAR